MSRRDKYIRAALTGLLANPECTHYDDKRMGELAAHHADAAIAAADASEPVEAEPEQVAEDGGLKVGDLCMFRDYESTNWDGPHKLTEILSMGYDFRYRHRWSWWRHCRKATAEEIANK
jgi:hypothetical protein